MVVTPRGHHGTHVLLPVVEVHNKNSDLVQIQPHSMAVHNVPVLRHPHKTVILITVQVCNFFFLYNIQTSSSDTMNIQYSKRNKQQ